jgi:hypothetical protein
MSGSQLFTARIMSEYLVCTIQDVRKVSTFSTQIPDQLQGREHLYLIDTGADDSANSLQR